MLSLRNTVVALVASGATVLVLTGIAAGVFSIPPTDALVPQANPVDQHAVTQQPNLLPQPVLAPQPAPAQQPDPAPQAVAIQQPDVAKQPITFAAAPVRRQAVTHPAVVRAPVPPQPVPAHDPAPIAEPAHAPEQDSSPPALSTRHHESRTVNTEPCACDGTMRRVPTHWDPPQN
ncbi:MAG: hypothetical protein LC721_00230 [Actinobacteria bacterium]|jgi:hypothetical protein|nr:hypothetical protein [Actinomycetota bacterium]